MLGSLSLAIDTRYNFVANFVSNLCLFDSIFSIIVWTNWLQDFDEGICFPATAAMKMDKRHFYRDYSNGCLEEKMLHWVIPC